jgi:pyruvate kinase
MSKQLLWLPTNVLQHLPKVFSTAIRLEASKIEIETNAVSEQTFKSLEDMEERLVDLLADLKGSVARLESIQAGIIELTDLFIKEGISIPEEVV